MKILLTGKNGQLGFELQRALAPLGAVVAVDSAECDLSNEKALRQLLSETEPDVIVNAAAYTAVDKAEAQPEVAQAVNARAPAIMGEFAKAHGAIVVHYSTDYVFGGEGDQPHTESDPTGPLNAYGQSKLDGESALAAAVPEHLIMRTSWVVGAKGHNFARTMLDLAQSRDELKVVSDQWGAPTSAALLADLTAMLLRDATRDRQHFPFGLYHVTASGATNWCDYARFVIEHARREGVALKALPENVLAIPSEAYPTAARRPKNSRLDCSHFESTFGLKLPGWQAGLTHILQQIV
ncbi:dTDP-4-dehydrorhamnose reductase [Hydrogenophaga sp. 5NK40-0174]|uniref:dTDP-4-dehydrorhamnose reductase n=1 Tax=Hydrogenophaga sp. 5NK40-0174 TaxID=3127649 RepID=UPI00310B2039